MVLREQEPPGHAERGTMIRYIIRIKEFSVGWMTKHIITNNLVQTYQTSYTICIFSNDSVWCFYYSPSRNTRVITISKTDINKYNENHFFTSVAV